MITCCKKINAKKEKLKERENSITLLIWWILLQGLKQKFKPKHVAPRFLAAPNIHKPQWDLWLFRWTTDAVEGQITDILTKANGIDGIQSIY